VPPCVESEGTGEWAEEALELVDRPLPEATAEAKEGPTTMTATQRRRALCAMGQYWIQDSGFAKMIAAKPRVEEVPPPRGRRRGRPKQFGQGSCLTRETTIQAERTRIAAERQQPPVPGLA
jgi:hypothetical protein